jgi:hypothetical protein
MSLGCGWMRLVSPRVECSAPTVSTNPLIGVFMTEEHAAIVVRPR